MALNAKMGESPVKTGMKHAGIGMSCIALIAATLATFIHFTGDASLGSDEAKIGLFADQSGKAPVLKSRFHDEVPVPVHDTTPPPSIGTVQAEPSLPVKEPGYAQASHTQNDEVDTSSGDEVRITRLDPNATPKGERVPLARAPFDGLHEPGPVGRLPKVSSGGLRPAEAYARPSVETDKPKIALIVGGLGIKRSLTRQAINDLPPEVTLSFVPYSSQLQTWVNQAREAGHEVLLEMPMEPYDYPNVDTGPDTLMTTLSVEENERRLKVILGQTTGYFGIINYMGAKLATDSRVLNPIMEEVHNRGLAMIYDGSAKRSVFPSIARDIGMNFVEADRIVDTVPSADAIDKNLLHLEALALQNGEALGVGFAFPVTVDQFKQWTETLSMKGYELVPASQAAGINTQEESHTDDAGH